MLFPDFSTVIRGAPRLVAGAPRCSQACRWRSQTCCRCSQVHPKFSPALQGVPKPITITPMVLLYQSSEIPGTLKAGRNALLRSDTLLKLTHLSLRSTSSQTLLEAFSDWNSFCWCLLVPVLPLSLYLKCLLHLSASHFALAADFPSEIRLALFEALVYGRSITELPLASRAEFPWLSASWFPGMPECPGTHWISVGMPWARRFRALLLIRLPSCCPGPGSRCAARRIAACESLKTATVFTPCCCGLSLLLTLSPGVSPIAQSSASITLRTSGAEIPSVGPPLITVLAQCCCSHPAVVWVCSICPPPQDSRPDLGFLLSCPALPGSVGCAFVVKYNGFNHWFFAWGLPAHVFGCPAVLVF